MTESTPTLWDEFLALRASSKALLLLGLALFVLYVVAYAIGVGNSVQSLQQGSGSHYCYTVAHSSICK